jgi:threonine synthase
VVGTIRVMPRRSYDPSTIRSLLAERARNRWSLGELSRRTGIPTGTLGTWAARARRAEVESSAPATVGFREVVVTDEIADDRSATVLLRHESGWTVELHGAAAAAVAAKLAEAVARCS